MLKSSLPGKFGWGLLALGLLATAASAQAERDIDLGVIKMQAPAQWARKQPASKIVVYEFGAPAAKDDSSDGRCTFMQAGGGVEANIDRWIGQFSQPDKTSTKDKAKISKKQVQGMEIHYVQLSGTFKDQPRGPFGPTVDRENYTMLGAIVVTPQAEFFVKFYGPNRTIAEHQRAFEEMLDGLQKK